MFVAHPLTVCATLGHVRLPVLVGRRTRNELTCGNMARATWSGDLVLRPFSCANRFWTRSWQLVGLLVASEVASYMLLDCVVFSRVDASHIALWHLVNGWTPPPQAKLLLTVCLPHYGCGVRLCGRTVCFHDKTSGNLADGVLRCLGAWNHWVLLFRYDVAFGFLVGFSVRYTTEVDFQGPLALSRSSSGTSFLTSVSLCPFLVERGVPLFRAGLACATVRQRYAV